MKSFITDSLAVSNKYKDFHFITDLYKWKLEFINNYISLKKEINHHINFYDNPPVAIVAPSNYKLIYDLWSLNKETSFYKPENFDFGKRKKFYPPEKKTKKLFDNYLKRSYISYLNYDGLSKLGLRRIEQYLLMMGLIPFQNELVFDNLKIKNDSKIIKKIEEKEYLLTTDKLNLIDFIYALGKKESFSFDDILTSLLRFYGELTISDPFDSSGFSFLKENDFSKYESEVLSSEIKVKEISYLCIDETTKKEFVLKIKKGNTSSDFLNNYYQLQKEEYFEDKLLYSKIKYPNILVLKTLLSDIIPFRDLILSLKLLLKMKKLTNENMYLELKKEDLIMLSPKENISWISSKIWKEIYDNQDYHFGQIIDPIQTKNKGFQCPLCGNETYRLNPTKLYCGEKKCRFFVNRINLKSFGIPKISVENIIEGLNSKSLLLKKKKGGYLNVFLKQNEDYFYFFLQ